MMTVSSRQNWGPRATGLSFSASMVLFLARDKIQYSEAHLQLDIAITQFKEGYFSTCPRSLKTQKAYQVDLGQFCGFVGDLCSLEQVQQEHLENWANGLRSRKYASVSIRRKFATLRVFFSYWVRRGVLDSSPFWKMRLDLARERQLPRNLSAISAKLLLEKAWSRVSKPSGSTSGTGDRRFLALRNLVAIEILFGTGMRVGELVSLRIPDWREDEASLLVRGKGSRQRLAFMPDKRSVEIIKTYLCIRRTFKVNHDALFVNSSGGRLSTQGVSRALAQLASEANIGAHVTPHMIRHTVATLLLRHGADIRVVQEVLGHASIVTTQRYTHISKEHLIDTLRVHHPNHHLNIHREYST